MYSNSLFAGIRLVQSASTARFAKTFLRSRYYCQNMDAKLEAVPLVDIDDDGRFKYILIKVYGKQQADGTEPSKLIVRGYKRAQWHGNEKLFIQLLYYSFNKTCMVISKI